MEKRESLTDVWTASRQSNAACEQADTFPNFYQGMMIASIEADHEIHIRRHFGLEEENKIYNMVNKYTCFKKGLFISLQPCIQSKSESSLIL